jgi:hypothetical protein
MHRAALPALLAPTRLQAVMCSCKGRVRVVVHLRAHASGSEGRSGRAHETCPGDGLVCTVCACMSHKTRPLVWLLGSGR